MAERRLTYQDHRRELAEFRYVYPVLSRRARGISVGINLNPDKGCNFDCVYCQVDRRGPRPRPGVDLAALQAELDTLLGWVADGTLFTRPPFDTAPRSRQVLRDVSFSGDGEPTTSPNFLPAVRLTCEVLDRLGLGHLSVNVITNATYLERPPVVEALALLDRRPSEIWAKLDAGTEAYYRRIDVTKIPLAKVLRGLLATARLRPIVIQSLFIRLDGAPPSEAEIEAWCGRLRSIQADGGQIKAVQVHTVARRPPTDRVRALPDATVDAIAERARQTLHGVDVQAYYGSSDWL